MFSEKHLEIEGEAYHITRGRLGLQAGADCFVKEDFYIHMGKQETIIGGERRY